MSHLHIVYQLLPCLRIIIRWGLLDANDKCSKVCLVLVHNVLSCFADQPLEVGEGTFPQGYRAFHAAT